MLGSFLGSSCEVVQVGKDDISHIMKYVCHCPLESYAPTFFKPKGMTQYEKLPEGVVNAVLY
jgi:hypothetical protein